MKERKGGGVDGWKKDGSVALDIHIHAPHFVSPFVLPSLAISPKKRK